MKSLAALVVFFGSFAFAKSVPQFVPGEFVVKLKEDNISLNLMTLKKNLDAKKVRALRGYKNWFLVTSDNDIESLKRNPSIEYTEPNYFYRAELRPSDKFYSSQWGLKNVGQKDTDGRIGKVDFDINIERAWDVTTGSSQVVVAVIDTGVSYKNKDLAPNAWVNEKEMSGKSGIDDDQNGYVDDVYGYDFVNEDGEPLDDQGHGSHCAGTIGARGNNDIGMAGINWQVRIMPVKFLSDEGSGTLAGALESIRYAVDNGAKVLSNSWGGGSFSQALEDAIKYTNSKGALFVASAGNDGEDSDEYPHYPSGYDVPNVVSVAALNNAGQVSDWSNFGLKTVHVAAPGENILSIALGTYDSWSGTSMATPFVSGIAALSLSRNMNLTGVQLKAKIMGSVRKVDSVKDKVITGGIVDAFGSL